MKTLKIKSIFSTILCVIWISGLSAQSLTVTGTVTDENDQPLIGANVSIEKSRKGTVTNAENIRSKRYKVTSSVFLISDIKPRK